MPLTMRTYLMEPSEVDAYCMADGWLDQGNILPSGSAERLHWLTMGTSGKATSNVLI
jgi:hypothetical protein